MNHVLLGNSFSCKGPSFKPYPKIINKLFGWAQTSMRHAVNSDTARCGQHWVKQNSHIYIDVLHELVLLTVDEESTSCDESRLCRTYDITKVWSSTSLIYGSPPTSLKFSLPHFDIHCILQRSHSHLHHFYISSCI